MKDPYIQENGTLKNKLGIEEYDDLNKAEKDIGFVKLIDVNKVLRRDMTQSSSKQYISIFLEIFLIGLENLGQFQSRK